MPDYSDVVMTARRAGLSDRPRPMVYVLHVATCGRVGNTPRPLDEYRPGDPHGGPEGLLRKVRHNLNAKACGYCRPDPAPRQTPTEGDQ